MLKLYYGIDKYLQVGYLNPNNPFVQLDGNDSNNSWKDRNYDANLHTVLFTLPTEVKSLAEFYQSTTSEKMYPIYLDSQNTINTNIGVVKHSDNGMSFHDISISSEVSWDNCFESFGNPAGLTVSSSAYQLTSIYSSPTDLEDNVQEYLYFVRQMVKSEVEIINDKFAFKAVNNLSQSFLTCPFVPIYNSTGIAGFQYNPGYNWQYLKLNAFINAANMYRWFTKKLLIPVDNVYINNVWTRPAVSYDPRKIDFSTLHYNFDGQNSLGVNTEIVNYSVVSSGVAITKHITSDLVFVQQPEKFLTYNEFIKSLNYKQIVQSGWYTPSWVVATKEDPTKFNSFVVSGGNTRYFYLQNTDIPNQSKVCRNQYPDSDYLSKLPGGNFEIPCLSVGFCFNTDEALSKMTNYNRSFVKFRYAIEDNIGSMTGLEYSAMFYNNEVLDFEDTVPNYEFPSNTGGGGSTTTPSDGGNGTWSDADDKTSIDPTKSPSEDPVSPMPESIGITGNCVIVKLDNTAVTSLASQSWTTEGWLEHIKNVEGTSRIGEGITDLKCCFLNIATGPQITVDKIAGFNLATPISANSVYQYTQYSFGSISIPRYFDSYLDFAPYTEFTLELPFAQPISIPPEQIVGDKLQIILRVDVMSGTSMYSISNSNHLICQVPADIFIDIPFTSSEYTLSRKQMLSNSLISVGKIGFSAASQNYLGMAVAGVEGAMQPVLDGINQEANRNITQISNGGGPGATGAMGIKKAVLKISRPYVEIPSEYYDFVGAPSGFIRTLSSCSGFFSVSEFYGNLNCTDDEYNEIVRQLRDGVFP